MEGNVSIMTKESDLQIKYGMYDFGEEREQARGSLKYILSDVHESKTGYFRLGFHLHEFKVYEYYKDFGYLTFEDFCENNLDMSKGAISRCINVFLMTTSQDEVTYLAGCKKTGCASQMSDRYKDYSYSQLCEMLPLDDEKRSQVFPEMTVKEIRELKNIITDISPDEVKAFVTPFTRENVIAKFIECGKKHLGTLGTYATFQFSIKKVSVNHSEYYSFRKIMDYYEKCGGMFEVATSQPEEITILYGSFKDDIFIADMLGRCRKFAESTNMKVINPTISGKRLTFEDSKGNTYMVQYSIVKKKEG